MSAYNNEPPPYEPDAFRKAPGGLQGQVGLAPGIVFGNPPTALPPGFNGQYHTPSKPLGGFPAEIIAAIVQVMSKLHSIEKDARNEFQRFDYTSVDAITAAVQPLMAEAGLVIFQTEASREFTGDNTILNIHYDFYLAHASGAMAPFAIQVSGMAGCRNSKGAGWDDKAINKCNTGARKFFLIDLFQIARGNDADADGSDSERGNRASPASPASRPQGQGGGQGGGNGRVVDQPPPRDGRVPPANEAENKLRAVYKNLLDFAREVKNSGQAHNLLDGWLLNAGNLETLRGRDAAWQPLRIELSEALTRAFGEAVSKAWLGSLDAVTESDMTKVGEHWAGEWSKGLAQMASAAPEAFDLLKQHMEMQSNRVSMDTPADEEAR